MGYSAGKFCRRCGIPRIPGLFGPYKTVPGSLRAWCLRCEAARTQSWRDQNPAAYKTSSKRASLKKKFGLSLEEWDRRKRQQDDRCIICRSLFGVESNKDTRACVDHCHATGKIRALLCGRCNLGLGKFRDNPETLRKAASYLEEFV